MNRRARWVEIDKLHREGLTKPQIAAKTGITPKGVAYALKMMRRGRVADGQKASFVEALKADLHARGDELLHEFQAIQRTLEVL